MYVNVKNHTHNTNHIAHFEITEVESQLLISLHVSPHSLRKMSYDHLNAAYTSAVYHIWIER